MPSLRGGYGRWVKPVFDRLAGGVLILALGPLIVTVALGVRFTLGAPVLLRQPRVGRDGRTFPMLKFRTMQPDRREGQRPFGGPDRRVCHKSDEDPRHTPLGRWLRRWSLDELPQLLNVLAGHMSLVGPRRELVGVVERYEPWQHQRHLVKPGVTGLWQVMERGNGALMHERTDIDLQYLERVSLLTDMAILVRTLPATLSSRRGS